MSIRTKVAVALAIAASVATLIVAAAAYRSTSDRLLAEVDRSLAQVVGGGRIGPGDRLPDRGPLSELAAQVVGPRGAVVQSNFPEPLAVDPERLRRARTAPGGELSTIESGGSDFRVLTIDVGRGFVQVGRPLDETQRVLSALRLRLWLVGLVVAVLAGAAGWLIASRLTEPLRRLTSTAERIGTTGDIDDALVAEVGAEVGDDGATAAGRDEVARLSRAFTGMLRALVRSRVEQRRLVQDAGHELRTPLTSLRTNLDTLRRHPDLDESDRAAIVADLHAETDELTDLVNEIVAAASGELADEGRRLVALDDLARWVADRAARRYDREIEVVDRRDPPSSIAVHADGVQRAISCLVDNAAKFDGSGSPVVIELADATGPDGTRRFALTVLDRGPGIDEPDRATVFERFARAESARALTGSGLGLSIVADVARRHQGGVTVADRPGGGAAVGFWIPVDGPPGPVDASTLG